MDSYQDYLLRSNCGEIQFLQDEIVEFLNVDNHCCFIGLRINPIDPLLSIGVRNIYVFTKSCSYAVFRKFTYLITNIIL